MFKSIMMVLMTVVMIVGIMSAVAHCQEFTYDGELSPAEVFDNYQTVRVVPVSAGNAVLERMRIGDGFPGALVALVRVVPGGVHLLCYAYIGKDNKLWNVEVNESFHYKEKPLSPANEKEIRNALFKLLGILDS